MAKVAEHTKDSTTRQVRGAPQRRCQATPRRFRVSPQQTRESSSPCPVPPWAFTCHDGFPVPFPIRPDPDELLPQEGGHIRVAVYKYSDRILQGNRSQIFYLPSTNTGMLTCLPGGGGREWGCRQAMLAPANPCSTTCVPCIHPTKQNSWGPPRPSWWPRRAWSGGGGNTSG